MLNKLFLSVMVVTSAFTLVFGQTPQPRADKQALPDKEFSLFFDGSGSYLGVQTTEVTKENFARLKLREVRGVAVEKVADNSPAAAAGILAGDVIVRFNGEEVTSGRKLTRLIGEVDPDHQAKITVIRDGSEREVTATLAKRQGFTFGEGNFKFDMPDFKGHWQNMPDFKGHFDLPQLKGNLDNMKEHFKDLEEHLKNLPNMQDHFKNLPDMKEHFKNLPQGDFQFRFPEGTFKEFSWHSGRQIGVGVTPLTKQLATHFGVTGGVLVEEVRENSPAAKAGIKAGDIIVEADGKAVTGDSDISRIINSKKDGDVQITYVRDGKRQTVTITPEQSKDGVWNFKTSVAPPVLSSPMVAPAPFVYSAPSRVM
jgi:serine protease Do